ncbi:MAG: GNAT family N-acetyltransferase [Haloglomus sp.]
MPGPVFRATEDGEVTIRPRQEEDHEFVRDATNQPGVRRLLRNTHPKNLQTVEDQYDEYSDNDDGAGFCICAPDEPVGHIGIWRIDHVNGSAWMGAWIHPDSHGEGYAPRGTALVVDYAFEELDLHRLNAGVYEPNRPSQRVMEKLGFTREGVQRESIYIEGAWYDTYNYGLLREEWDGYEG